MRNLCANLNVKEVYPLTPLLFCAIYIYMLLASLTYTGIGALVGVGVLLAGLPLLLIARH